MAYNIRISAVCDKDGRGEKWQCSVVGSLTV